MDDDQRRALQALRFNWAPTAEDVWAEPEAHVHGLHESSVQTIMAAFQDARDGTGHSPLGVPVTGQQGAGKTHLLTLVRKRVREAGGYFFLISLMHHDGFWRNVVQAMLSGLAREDQLRTVLRELADRLCVSDHAHDQIIGKMTPTKAGLGEIVHALMAVDPRYGRECRNTLRALIILNSDDLTASEVGEAYLMSSGEAETGERMRWGIHPDPMPPRRIVSQLSRLISLTGPTLLAVDQIDTLIAQSARSTKAGDDTADQDTMIGQLGIGLMDLRESTHRTVTVVACQHHTWDDVRRRAVVSVNDRFQAETRLRYLPSAVVGRELIAARFGPALARRGFTPPHPTWPVAGSAFADSPNFTARGLLKRIDAHIRHCLDVGTVIPLTNLSDDVPELPPTVEPVVSGDRMTELDECFARFRDQVDPSRFSDHRQEDDVMPGLFEAGLRGWIEEQGEERERYSLDPVGPDASFHARLRRTLVEETEDQEHWTFRSIGSPNARAVINRVRKVRTVSGLDPDVPKRKVYVLRDGPWPNGAKTQAQHAEFLADGGVVLGGPELEDDLRVFAALSMMWEDPAPDLSAWLRSRRPAGNTAVLRSVFGESATAEPVMAETVTIESATDAPRSQTEHQTAARGPSGSTVYRLVPPAEVAESETAMVIGRGTDTGTEMAVPFAALRKHTAIFAGSGSGKTVLIRRIVEECAMAGVSSIVLDPNNDLARLGDAWPAAPEGWFDGDPTRAEGYLTNTEVVVWTPRREAGRPLSFQPLPDLAATLGDPDEFGQALDIAVAALAPRVKADKTTAKAEQLRAVLRESLDYFARAGGAGLEEFLELLGDLPEEAASLSNAVRMGQEMAQTLTAVVINDPMFGGAGSPVDPALLLTPTPGKRARISVISFIGLPGNEQRQSFVNQLQMALFAWIKNNPAADRPLGGLLVMDEAQTLAPSGAMTACTDSTLALASQARKYGLGLIFATQAPKGIHNRIVGNAATQFFGFLNSPVQIAAAEDIARAKSGGVPDISRLKAGQFYAGGEGLPFQKIATPMCLSHHPPSPLTTEEVLARAKRSRSPAADGDTEADADLP